MAWILIVCSRTYPPPPGRGCVGPQFAAPHPTHGWDALPGVLSDGRRNHAPTVYCALCFNRAHTRATHCGLRLPHYPPHPPHGTYHYYTRRALCCAPIAAHGRTTYRACCPYPTHTPHLLPHATLPTLPTTRHTLTVTHWRFPHPHPHYHSIDGLAPTPRMGYRFDDGGDGATRGVLSPERR